MTRRICPVCHGKGTIDNPKEKSETMMYCGPNGEYYPQRTCPNCNGEGFIGLADNLIKPSVVDMYRTKDVNVGVSE